MNKWFKRFPYAGWITIFCVSLITCISLYRYGQLSCTPDELLLQIQNDFQRREQALVKDRKAGAMGSQVPRSALYDLVMVNGDQPVNWSTHQISVPPDVVRDPMYFKDGRLFRGNSATYYIRSWPQLGDSGLFAIAFIPICYQYEDVSPAFQSRFVAGAVIPPGTQVSEQALPDARPVYNNAGEAVFYVQFQPADTAELYQAGIWVWISGLIVAFSFCIWIHECCFGIGYHRRRFFDSWLLLVAMVIVLSLIVRYVDLPIGFRNNRLFSPELFSSGDDISSLGELMMLVLLKMWLFTYLLSYTSIARRRFFKRRNFNVIIKVAIAFGLALLLFRSHADYMYKLVIDSKISFEVADFSNLSVFTFLGVLTLAFITISFLVLVGIINGILAFVTRKLTTKYVVLICLLTAAAWYCTDGSFSGYYVAVIGMSLAATILIDTFGLPLSRRRHRYELSVSPATYIWFAILCSWITLEVFYFNFTKEKELRTIFAQKQAPRDDLSMYNFEQLSKKLRRDSVVVNFMRNPDTLLLNRISKYLQFNYFTADPAYSRMGLYFYDKQRKNLIATDSADRPLLRLGDSIAGRPLRYGIFNVQPYVGGDHFLWLLAPVLGSGSAGDTLGFIGAEVMTDARPRKAKQRSLFQRKYNPTDQQYFDKYTYAVYRNGKLWSQEGAQTFPYEMPHPVWKREITFEDSWNTSVLHFKSSDKDWVTVVYDRNLLLNLVSLFSYILAVTVGVTGAIVLFRQLLFYPLKLRVFLRNINLTIRSKVNLTILITVFASLLIVGIITLSFINDRYKDSQRRDLQSLLFYYSQSVLRYIDDHHLNMTPGQMDLLAVNIDLSYKLNELAEEQGAEINVYDEGGRLISTSQLELHHKGLLSPFMNPSAFSALREGQLSELTTEEYMGTLAFKSVYTPLKNRDGRTMAYINLPNYTAASEMNRETSDLLFSLINVYTFVFFLSGICAMLVSNSIVRSFRLLIEQFRNIRLSRNEVIQWPYKDEIGVLVREYNRMMMKVEAMAAKLALTEREAAWRDIARQVAHEIKNPLTPMKLHIQYLQQAIKEGRSGVDQLAARVSVTLIEQIENLNVIATEFSNFAKMPQAHPETLDMAEVLQSVVSLFQKDSNSNLSMEAGTQPVWVHMDKNYLIRIFNNLIQNAVQSLPQDGTGWVKVQYEQKDAQVVVSIRDNGCGISTELQDKLFTPYFTTKSSGTGLGLPITRNMIIHSGGNIWFESETGSGSVFFVALPLAPRGQL